MLRGCFQRRGGRLTVSVSGWLRNVGLIVWCFLAGVFGEFG